MSAWLRACSSVDSVARKQHRRVACLNRLRIQGLLTQRHQRQLVKLLGLCVCLKMVGPQCVSLSKVSRKGLKGQSQRLQNPMGPKRKVNKLWPLRSLQEFAGKVSNL